MIGARGSGVVAVICADGQEIVISEPLQKLRKASVHMF